LGLLDGLISAASSVASKAEELHAQAIDLQQQIGKGIVEGGYDFAKGMVTGVIDVGKAGYKIVTDPQARQAFWDGAQALGKDAYKLQYGTPEEKLDVLKKIKDYGERVGNGIKQQVESDWSEASKNGTRAELISKWTTEGVLNIATLFIPAGEAADALRAVKAEKQIAEVAEVGKALEAAKGVDAANAISKTEKVVDGIETCGKSETAAAKVADASGEAGKVAKVGEWPTPKAQEQLNELERLAKEPQTPKTPHLKRLQSEQLGNEAAKTELRRQLGKEIPESQFKTFSGANTVNVMYVDQNGKVYVLEAKGGTSELGSRKLKFGPNRGARVEQGTMEYLEDVAESMVRSGDPDKAVAGQQILDAIAETPPKIEYIGVRGAYNKVSPAGKIVQPAQIFKLP
jgi:hypothetical protein